MESNTPDNENVEVAQAALDAVHAASDAAVKVGLKADYFAGISKVAAYAAYDAAIDVALTAVRKVRVAAGAALASAGAADDFWAVHFAALDAALIAARKVRVDANLHFESNLRLQTFLLNAANDDAIYVDAVNVDAAFVAAKADFIIAKADFVTVTTIASSKTAAAAVVNADLNVAWDLATAAYVAYAYAAKKAGIYMPESGRINPIIVNNHFVYF